MVDSTLRESLSATGRDASAGVEGEAEKSRQVGTVVQVATTGRMFMLSWCARVAQDEKKGKEEKAKEG